MCIRDRLETTHVPDDGIDKVGFFRTPSSSPVVLNPIVDRVIWGLAAASAFFTSLFPGNASAQEYISGPYDQGTVISSDYGIPINSHPVESYPSVPVEVQSYPHVSQPVTQFANQVFNEVTHVSDPAAVDGGLNGENFFALDSKSTSVPVSYTHLTLPTICSV